MNSIWDDEEPLPYVLAYPGELDEDDRFEFDTTCYFNFGTTNQIEIVMTM